MPLSYHNKGNYSLQTVKNPQVWRRAGSKVDITMHKKDYKIWTDQELPEKGNQLFKGRQGNNNDESAQEERRDEELLQGLD